MRWREHAAELAARGGERALESGPRLARVAQAHFGVGGDAAPDSGALRDEPLGLGGTTVGVVELIDLSEGVCESFASGVNSGEPWSAPSHTFHPSPRTSIHRGEGRCSPRNVHAKQHARLAHLSQRARGRRGDTTVEERARASYITHGGGEHPHLPVIRYDTSPHSKVQPIETPVEPPHSRNLVRERSALDNAGLPSSVVLFLLALEASSITPGTLPTSSSSPVVLRARRRCGRVLVLNGIDEREG
ncbi:hypothetical protein EXIGLDRAFT_768683 [Exidia glandulosa HHB12029]|uniref:Uncharacterized protein n=1 Tax=Exidia glandulosa HHB12029 TaxID=1314781 RepID=A0A165I1F0_EXIGL|nr:hypothetical protein EXIGLDRAFT_768683 [Exidia glandulosa HHB12029]